MALTDMLHMLAPNTKKKYRIVLDGNGDYRIQYKLEQTGGAMITSQIEQWYFDDRKFKSAEDAKHAIGECRVEKVIEEL